MIRADLEGTACNSTTSIDLSSVQSVIKPTATRASIIVPSTVMGQPTADFMLKAKFAGLYGQSSSLDRLTAVHGEAVRVDGGQCESL